MVGEGLSGLGTHIGLPGFMRTAIVQSLILAATLCSTVATSTIDECSSSSDCVTGDVCVGGVCQSPVFEEPCGNTTCAGGLQCCNASCGICVQPGNACTQQVCAPSCTADGDCQNGDICIGGSCFEGERCGPTWCGPGKVCCNALSGICTDPGMLCTQ